MFSGVC